MSHDDDGVVTESVSFEVGPDIRDIRDAAVSAFDDALASAGTGEVMHLVDPKRINAFTSGGPPVWSVAMVPHGDSSLYLTYGLSGAIDPARAGCGFELSIQVAGKAETWPVLLLRGLARYMLESGREIESGQYMPLGAAISRVFVHPDGRDKHPDTPMTSVYLTADPDISSIAVGDESVEVRRVVGLHPDELELLELTNVEAFIAAQPDRAAALTCDLSRGSIAGNPSVSGSVYAASTESGSAFSYVAVPGVHWSHAGDVLELTFPGGEHAQRIHRMLKARLPFGRHLLVQDLNSKNQLAIAFEPSDKLSIRHEGPVLVLSWSVDHESLETLRDAGEEPVIWEL